MAPRTRSMTLLLAAASAVGCGSAVVDFGWYGDEPGQEVSTPAVTIDDGAEPALEDTAFPSLRLPELEISEQVVDLEQVPVGCSADAEFWLANVGDAPLSIHSAMVVGSRAVDLLSPLGDDAVLEPGESMPLQIRFSPERAGEVEAQLFLQSDDPDARELLVPVVGSGEYADALTDTWDPQVADILLLVDTSDSMTEHIAMLETSLVPFISALQFSGTDFRLAAIVEDDGCVQGEILFATRSHGSSEGAEILRGMIRPPVVHAREHARAAFTLAEAAIDASFAGGCNESLLRTGAQLHLIAVSDRAEQSPDPYGAYLERFDSALGSEVPKVVHGVGGPPPDGCKGAEVYSGVVEASQETGGRFESICDSWTNTAYYLAGAIYRAMVPSSVPLSHEPLPESIEVWVDGGEMRYGWSYDRADNAVIFEPEFLPTPGVGVDVRYTPLGVCD